ncbi:MAG: sugar phosphate isomerase/epimerase [Acidobacteriaceae bacterium]|nr:sugar phosphate isomerase/epimerase [Acidobacteriaceae bacterium]
MSDDQISRRAWLGAIPGAIGLAAAMGDRAEAQEYRIAGADLKLGVASYSFRNFSREQAIKMTKELGTPYINVKDFHLPLNSTPEQMDAARKEFEDAGLVIVGCGNVTFNKDDEAAIRQNFEYAKRLGAPLIVCAPTHATLPKMEKFVKEFDIKIAVHNHGPEDKQFPTPQSVLEVVKNMDPRCGLCIDVGHTARTGVDVVASIAEAGPRLLDMHLKDLGDMRVKESQVAVGEGKMPIRQIFMQLIKMKYKGAMNLEYEINADDPMPGMQKSFAYMRRVLTEIQGGKDAT